MRRSWEIDTDALAALACVWFAVGFMATFVAMLVWQSRDRHGNQTGPAWVHSPVHWLLPIWLGPFALAASALALYCVGLGIRALWRNPPVRRVTKPVTEDLRGRR